MTIENWQASDVAVIGVASAREGEVRNPLFISQFLILITSLGLIVSHSLLSPLYNHASDNFFGPFKTYVFRFHEPMLCEVVQVSLREW